MDNLENIGTILKKLEYNIGILTEALKKEEMVSLINNDIFKSIINSIKELEKYDNKNLKGLFAYYRLTIHHLNLTFSNKEYINQEDIAKVNACLIDIKKLLNIVNVNLPYDKFISDLKNILRNLKSVNIDSGLTYNFISKDILRNYENIIIKYRNLISEISEIKPYMNINDFEAFKLDLNINYSALMANLNEIYIEIINSNSNIADPLMNKLKSDVNNGNYDSILKTSMVNKVIDNHQRRHQLSNNLDILIESLNVIINRYEFSKVDKRKTNIDVEYLDDDKNEDYGIDIPQFIEDNYNKHKKNQNNSYRYLEYDKKISAFIARFEILKRKLERKKSLTKEEVKIYNKLESELELLKKNDTNRFISSIKFNYYYKALNKKIKLSRKNKFKQVINSNKKRK